ncbi:MAG: DNA-binding protein [Desulfurococcales archaeon]|nr:DNA-binding protein [Desulfurococcales archaeon]
MVGRYKALAVKTSALVIVLIVIVAAIAGYILFMAPKGGETTTPTTSAPTTSISTTSPPATSSSPTMTATTSTQPVPGKIIVVAFKGRKEIADKDLVPWSSINPGFLRDPILDALIMAGRYTTDPDVREIIYNAIQKLSNKDLSLIWLVQTKQVRVYWGWLESIYFHPTLFFRADHISKDPNASNPETLIIGDTEEGHSLDPAVSYWAFDWRIIHQIYETLVTYERDETSYVVPQLAVAWAHNEEGDEWYFVIRGGVVFYDPWENKTIPLTPDDVVYSFKRVVLMHQDPYWLIDTFLDVNKSSVVSLDEFNNLLSNGLVTEFKGESKTVKSLDELLNFFNYSGEIAGVVKLKLKFPYAGILPVLATKTASIVCKEVVEAHGGIKPGEENEFLYEHPVGTGPYYLVKWEHKQYYQLRVNPYYWGGKPSIKEVFIKLIPEDETRILQLKKGDLDYAVVPSALIDKVQGVSKDNWNLIVKTPDSFVIWFVVVNCKKEPFSNPDFREALAWAIPYNEIIASVYNNLASQAYGVIPRGMFGFQDDDLVKYTLDQGKAQAALQRSGVDPSKVSITILIPQGYSALEQTATLLQASWSQILGVKVDIQILSRPVFNEKMMSGDFDVYILGWGPDYIDPDDYTGPLQSSGYEYDSVKAYLVDSLDEASKYIDVDNAVTVTYKDWTILVGEAKG